MLLIADPYRGRKPNGSYSNQQDAYSANTCLDYPAPTDVKAYTRWATKFDGTAPRFAAMIAYNDLACAFWPVPAERVPHKVSAPGAPPIVVVGATGDPATPYAWSVALAKELQSGVLVTRKGEGHTSYDASNCVQKAVDAYLLDLKVPKDGLSLRLGSRISPVRPARAPDHDQQERRLDDVDAGDDQRDDERQGIAQHPADAGRGGGEGQEHEPHAADHARARPSRPPASRVSAAREQDDGQTGRQPDQRRPDQRRRMDDRLERAGRRAEQRGRADRERTEPEGTEPGDARAHAGQPAGHAPAVSASSQLDLGDLAVDDPPGAKARLAGRRVRLVVVERDEHVQRVGVEREADVRRRRHAPACGVRVDDRPEHLVGVVGRDRQPEQVVGSIS